jgi:ribosomal protein S13
VLLSCILVMLCVCNQGVENKRCYELNEEEINKIREEVGKYTTEADLVSSLRRLHCNRSGSAGSNASGL